VPKGCYPCNSVTVFDTRIEWSGLDAEFFEEDDLKMASGKLGFNNI
jgi:hypothetical protein